MSNKKRAIHPTTKVAGILALYIVKKAEASIPTTAEEYLTDLIIPSDLITLKKNDQYYALPVTKML